MLKNMLLNLLKPIAAEIVKKAMEKLLTYLNEQNSTGTLSLTDGVPDKLVNETVEEILS